jgi:hypothetical protein
MWSEMESAGEDLVGRKDRIELREGVDRRSAAWRTQASLTRFD